MICEYEYGWEMGYDCGWEEEGRVWLEEEFGKGGNWEGEEGSKKKEREEDKNEWGGRWRDKNKGGGWGGDENSKWRWVKGLVKRREKI